MTVLTGPISPSSDSEAWLNALRSSGLRRDQAVASLYGLLLGGARFEIARRRACVGYVRGEDCDDIAMQAADDALVAVLTKLNQFRGESRFTTWAYKFALLEAGVRIRRHAWQQREVVLDSDSWRQLAEAAAGPDVSAEQAELFHALTDFIGDDLTAHQRRVLVAITLEGVPVDVLAERLNTTRGALYKTLHDARRKLRILLADRGLPVEAL
jgi:RNA polymerase sigma-70 factor (ECF subfamily)